MKIRIRIRIPDSNLDTRFEFCAKNDAILKKKVVKKKLLNGFNECFLVRGYVSFKSMVDQPPPGTITRPHPNGSVNPVVGQFSLMITRRREKNCA